MYKTQKCHLKLKKKEFKLIKALTHRSKDIYNYTLFVVRKYFFENNKYLSYEQAYHLVKDSEAYRNLPAQISIMTMRIVDRNMKSFFRLIKERKKGNYNRPICLPKYLPKDSYFVCIFPKQMFKIEKDRIKLFLNKKYRQEFKIKEFILKLPKNIIGKEMKEVRIVPKCGGKWFEIEYVYKDNPLGLNLDKNKILSIDLGLDNFATCIDTNGTTFIIEGRYIKSFNHWYHKKKALLQSIYSKQKIKGGDKLCKLSRKRKFVINNFMNQAVSYIIKHCLKNSIGKIVIGKLKGIKQNINLGKKNNQNFCSISHGLFKQKLKSKCEYYNIEYIEVDEAYSSQTCCKCGIIRRNNRKYRGLYICKNCGQVINADVNGAINILKKVAQESLNGILGSGCVAQPVRIRVVPIKRLPNFLQSPSTTWVSHHILRSEM